MMLIVNEVTRQMRTLHHGQAPNGWLSLSVLNPVRVLLPVLQVGD